MAGERERERDRERKDREKALDLAVAQIEKLYGRGAIMRLGTGGVIAPVAAIPTGSLELDHALGVGGIPRGRVTEIFGPESSGKTTLALHVICQAQKRGGAAAFIDAEHALDAKYARALGVNVDDLLLSQPDTGEQALEITEVLVRSGAVDVIVIDSVAALVPRAEIEGEMGDAHMGLHAASCPRPCASSRPPSASRGRRWSSSTRSGRRSA
jgi:recombination protein RecA